MDTSHGQATCSDEGTAIGAPSEAPNKAAPGGARTTSTTLLRDADGEQQDRAAAKPKEHPPDEPGLPIEPPFAPPRLPLDFWQDLLTLILLGLFLGCFGAGYIKVITLFPKLWTTTYGNPGFPSDPASLGFACGEVWWIGVGAACGLVVGAARVLLRLDDMPSFIDEIKAQHVEPWTSVRITACALLSLMGGVSMGPEAGLGAFGAAVGQVASTWPRKLPPTRQKLYVVSCMAGAFAAFVPNPYTAVLLTTEIGLPPNLWGVSMLHMLTLYSIAASASFVSYYAIVGYTYLDPESLYRAAESFPAYDQRYIFIGVLFGFMGAGLAVAFFLIAGVVKAVTGKLRGAMEARLGPRPTRVAMALLGGTVYGVFMYVFPLTIGDGSMQLATVMSQPSAVGSSVLAASAFAKMFTYWVCVECGFVGGIFFPCIITSTMLGGVFVNVTGVNPVVGMSCSFIAMCAAFIPMPFFLIVMTVSSLSVGPQGFIPVFATAMTAYLFFVGIGIPQGLVAMAKQRQQKKLVKAGSFDAVQTATTAV